MEDWLENSFGGLGNNLVKLKNVKAKSRNHVQSAETHQGQSEAMNTTNSILTSSDDSTEQAARSTTSNGNKTTCSPSKSRPLNEALSNQASSSVQKKSLPNAVRYPMPQDWEKREICQLGSITKKDFHVTLFAVVKFFNPPKQSKGHHKYSHFGLVDQTLYENDDSLKCICFQTHEEDMPLITNEGDVIKFPARISTYQGKLQARTPDGQFPWMTFDGRPNVPIVPRYSRCSAPNFTDADKKKVEELKSWAASVGINKPYVTLADLDRDQYFDFLCQVVYVDSGDNSLYVWDGTEPSFKEMVHHQPQMFCNATKWGDKVMGKCVKVHIYGLHVESTFKPGHYVLIPGLHFILKRGTNDCVTQVPLLTLHERMLFKRRIEILDEDHCAVEILEQRMEALPESYQTPSKKPRAKSPESVTADQKKVEELKSWAASIGINKPFVTLADLDRDQYFDFLCQVVYVDSGDNSLYVWDGTEPSFKAVVHHQFQMFRNATKWGNKVMGKCVKVHIYGPPVESTFKPGHYVLLPALHFTLKQGPYDYLARNVTQIPLLTLQERMLSKRQIEILDENHCAVKILEQRMEALPESCQSPTKRAKTKSPKSVTIKKKQVKKPVKPAEEEVKQSVDDPCPSLDTIRDIRNGEKVPDRARTEALPEYCQSSIKKARAKSPESVTIKTKEVEIPGKPVEEDVNQGVDDPCPPLYTIRDIRDSAEVQDRVCCWATVLYYMPEEPKEFVRYACKSCREHYEHSGDSQTDSSTIAKCPNEKCGAVLSPIIIFSVILQDRTGLLDARVSDKVARKFLPSAADPMELLTNESVQTMVKDFLHFLKQFDIEFEIKGFTDPKGKFLYSLIKWKAAKFKNELYDEDVMAILFEDQES